MVAPVDHDREDRVSGGGEEASRRAAKSGPPVAPGAGGVALVVVVLLFATTTLQGAFALSRWAPLALLCIALLTGAILTRKSTPLCTPPAAAMLMGIWGLAGWTALSVLWAQSRGSAWIGADRTVLYATIATIPFALPVTRRALAAAAWAPVGGIGLIAAYTLVRLLADGTAMFLAGRLNGPVNYRNATALLFAMPVWPLVMIMAARGLARGIRAGAFATTVLCLGLAFLTQSRGILLGLGVGGALAVLCGPDRMRRAWTAVLAVACVALASPWLLWPYHAFDGGHGYVGSHDIEVAAWALAAVTVAAFVAGLALALFDNGLRVGSPRMRIIHRASRLALALGGVLALAGGLVAVRDPVSYAQQKWNDFRNLSDTSSDARLLSTGGQRYDLWRVALREFQSEPVLGVGTDNYSFGYYRQRRNNRNLNDPHSLVFALLSENGIVGALLLLLFLGGCAASVRSGWPRLSHSARRDALAPAAAGAVLIGQSAVDWMWLIPGLTALGLLLLALGAAHGALAATVEQARPSLPRSARRFGRVAAVGMLVMAAASILALYLSDAYVQRARTVTGNPAAELAAARTAAMLDPWSLTPRYLEASAYESMGQRARAYAQLQAALRLEPQNFATLGVIGDFEVRSGDPALAREYYARALALNPLDVGLQQLARIRQIHAASHPTASR